MQIKIEIEVRPEELRRFIGLPDVAGLQDDVVEFIREKLHQAGENFDAGAFVKSNLKLLSRSSLLGKFFTPGKEAPADGGDSTSDQDGTAEEMSAAASTPKRSKAGGGRKQSRRSTSAAARKSSRRKPAPATSAPG